MLERVRSLGLLTLGLAVACTENPVAPNQEIQPDLSPAAHPPITVMTRNMYIGANVDRVIGALSGLSREDPQAALSAVLHEFITTDITARIGALADEIARHRPLAVGLQEVSQLGVHLPPEFGVPAIEVDFLAGLEQALALRGLSYHVIRNQNFQFSLFGGAIGLQDTDVLLLDQRLPLISPANGTFSCGQLCIPVPNLGTLTRGWVRASTTIAGRTITFVSTHPESGAHPAITALRAGQMAELAAILQNESGTVILMGDLNDTPGSPMYQVLAGAGFVDVWASLQPGQSGYTCCHTTDLHSGSFSQRIDYVMVRGGFLNDDGQVVGGGRIQVIGEKAEEQVNGAFGLIWPSDHGGVVVSLPPAR
jgi:Endonuclease/Exonuclease/phosphatase family